MQSAFSGDKCKYCVSFEEKLVTLKFAFLLAYNYFIYFNCFCRYGPPVECSNCHVNAAFNKPADKLEKVGGQPLCMNCTRSLKRK